MKCQFTQEELDKHFGHLESALKGVMLQRMDGSKSEGTTDEFMLMQQNDDLTLAFKHWSTRNYVYLREKTLLIPKTGNAFNRGEF